MTERVLPGIGVGVRPTPTPGAATRPDAAARSDAVARPVAARPEALLSTPTRAAMLLGASAAVYAVTLAGVAALQARQDAATTAAAAPVLDITARTAAANDLLETRIGSARGVVASLIEDYGTLGSDVAAYQARLDELAALVAEVEGSAAALPDRIRLPAVSVRIPSSGGGGGGGAAPKTSGRSGASGG